MLPTTPSDHSPDHVDSATSLADAPTIASVLDSNDPAVRALIQAAVAHHQQAEAAAAAAAAAAAGSGVSAPMALDSVKIEDVKSPLAELLAAAASSSSAHAALMAETADVEMAALPDTVPEEILRSLIPVSSAIVASVAEQGAVSASESIPISESMTSATTMVTTSTLTSAPIVAFIPERSPVTGVLPAVTSVPIPTTTTTTVNATPESIAVSTAPSLASASETTLPTSATCKAKSPSASTSSSSSTSTSNSTAASRPFVSTKKFNPDDIFCLGCCRNLSVDHYTCPSTNRIFKSCNACRQKSRINSKKIVKPPAIPTKPTISMEEFAAKLKDLEESQEETSLDVMVRMEGSVEMDPETLKTRGAQIAAQVYESTGYWFSHSRTNDETQSKTRLKIYGCSQREDRRAPPAPKTQSRKRNRPSTKSYFPCKGNLTMTFYHEMNHVRVVYGHKRHAKYDNRKCPDHVRAYVKENLGMAPRQLFDTLIETNPGLGITQAQVRYWSHFYKKNVDPDEAGSPTSSTSGEGKIGIDGGDHITGADSLMEQVSLGSGSNGGINGTGGEQNDASLLATASTTDDTSLAAQQHALQLQTDEEREHHERVHQLLLASASNAAALESLAAQHAAHQNLLGGSIAISVPMSGLDDDENSPLTSSIVQRVLSENGGKGLLDLQASLRAVSEATAASVASASAVAAAAALTSSDVDMTNGGDAVVQQVTAFMKENDQQQQQLLAQQQQLHEHQLQEQQQMQEHQPSQDHQQQM